MNAANEVEILQSQLRVAEELIKFHVGNMAIIHEAMGSPFKSDTGKNARDLALLAAEKLKARPVAVSKTGDAVLQFPHDATKCTHCVNVANQIAAIHPAEIILEEMATRGWDHDALINAMGPFTDDEQWGITHLAFEMYFEVRQTDVILGEHMAEQLGRAFDVDPRLFLNMHEQWRAAVMAVAL